MDYPPPPKAVIKIEELVGAEDKKEKICSEPQSVEEFLLCSLSHDHIHYEPFVTISGTSGASVTQIHNLGGPGTIG